MIASDLINPLIPTVTTADSAMATLEWMDEFRVSQLPVVEEKQYKGLIEDTKMLIFADDTNKVGDFELTVPKSYATENQHFFDIIYFFNEYDVELIPVLDSEDNYLGVISIKDTAKVLSKSFASEMPGGIITLSIDYRDYSMAEIARLVESNNAKIVNSFLEINPEVPTKLELTIKLNTLKISPIIGTLERFGYNIMSKFQQEETTSLETERFNSLMKYLEL
ncbi:MAG: acetoin utilization protein AcuB [Arenicella sp.]|jgi:acetoin utilization protein AcuB